VRLLLFLIIILSNPGNSQAAPTIRYYSNMDSRDDITTPEVGPTATVSPNLISFPEGHSGNEASWPTEDADARTTYIHFPNDGITRSEGTLKSELMIEFWWHPRIESASGGGRNYLVTQYSSTGRNQFSFVRWENQTIVFNLTDKNGLTRVVSIGNTEFVHSINDRIHVRFWYDETLVENNMKVWLYNENTDTSYSETANFAGDFDSLGTSTVLRLGNYGDNTGWYMNGGMDEFYVYDEIAGTPTISSLSSGSAREGDTLSINGSNFTENHAENGTVTFDGVEATIQSWADTEIVVTVPSSTNGNIVVNTYAGSSSGTSFSYLPKISYSGYASSIETLYLGGSGFGTTQGDTTVSIAGQTLGVADIWNEQYVYYKNLSSVSGEVNIDIEGENSFSDITQVDIYRQYPNDPDQDLSNLISFWPMDDNFNDVQGGNDFEYRELRPSAGGVIGNAFRGDRVVAQIQDEFLRNPIIFQIPETGEYLLVYKQNGLGGDDGSVDAIIWAQRSVNGVEWGDKYQIYSNLAIPGDAGILLSNGTILLFGMETGGLVTKVIGSTDNGYTFTDFGTLPSNPSLDSQRPFGKPIELSDGTIIKPSLVGTGGLIWLSKSTDSGRTWTYLSDIYNYYSSNPSINTSAVVLGGATVIPVSGNPLDAGFSAGPSGAKIGSDTFFYTGVTSDSFTGVSGVDADHGSGEEVSFKPKFNETNIVKAPDENNLLAITRDEEFQHTYLSRSTDQGETWSKPVAANFSGTYLTQLKGVFAYTHSSGKIFITARGTLYWYSDDNGNTWWPSSPASINPIESNSGLIDSVSFGGYQGYGSFIEESDGRIAFYYNLEAYDDSVEVHDVVIKKNYIDPTLNKGGHYLNVTDSDGDDSLVSSEFSVSFWFKLDDYAGVKQFILAKQGNDSRYPHWYTNYLFYLSEGTTPKMNFGFPDSGGTVQWSTSQTSLVKDEWYHVTGTFDGKKRRLFIDGALEDIDTATLRGPNLNTPLLLGHFSYYTSQNSVNKSMRTGVLDNLKFFNTAISPIVILAQANYSVPTISSISPSPSDQGSQITISGSNFGLSQGSSTVSINGAVISPDSWSNTRILISIPLSVSNGAHNIVVTVNDVVSNSSSFVAGIAPVISNIQTNITASDAIISWTTDELATSQVVYWREGGEVSSISSSNLVSSHAVILNGLSPSTKYYYYIESSDGFGSKATSSTSSFTTQSLSSEVNTVRSFIDIPYPYLLKYINQENEEVLLETGKIINVYSQYPVFVGTTYPNSNLELIIFNDKNKFSYQTTSDSIGGWKITVNEILPDGVYFVKTLTTKPSGEVIESLQYEIEIVSQKKDEIASSKEKSLKEDSYLALTLSLYILITIINIIIIRWQKGISM